MNTYMFVCIRICTYAYVYVRYVYGMHTCMFVYVRVCTYTALKELCVSFFFMFSIDSSSRNDSNCVGWLSALQVMHYRPCVTCHELCVFSQVMSPAFQLKGPPAGYCSHQMAGGQL